jgi:hypothetical protein
MRNQTLDAREVVNDLNFGRRSRRRLKRAPTKALQLNERAPIRA